VVPPHLPTGEDNIRSLALVKACLASAHRGGDWVALAEIMAGA
jgi:hypothetical protein